MDKKIITLLIILIFSVGCLSFVSADNNTTGNLTVENSEGNLTDYIIPVYITNNGIEFSDGFTGFCIDTSKDAITANDQFTSQNTKNDEIQNNVKLAIIECYKSGKENDIQNVVSQVLNGNKKYDVVESVLNSSESISDTTVVKINNTTEATFTFELLKPTNDAKSDCLAYTVSLKKVAGDDVLGTANDENDTADNTTENNSTTNNTNASDVKQETTNQTVINTTDNTIINKTDNTIINETNTTIINQNNTKIINKTNETPQNATIQEKIMRATGNPILILMIVVIVIAVVAVAIRRKD